MKQDSVYLVWKDVKTGKKYKVAILYKKIIHFILNTFSKM